MNLDPISVDPPIILCLLTIITAASYGPASVTCNISVNCGSTGTSVAIDGREWHGDMNPEVNSSPQTHGSSSSSSIMRQLIAPADPVPHKTARISRSKFSYTFQVNPGLKLIRLHFNPTWYKGCKLSKDLFTVESGAFILLGNFSASLTADALGVNAFVKEFCINIKENQLLDVVFTSASRRPQDGIYAFINGIEIISVPKDLSYFHGVDLGAQAFGEKSMVYIDNSTALEIIYKLNILQESILSADDSAEMIDIGATIPIQKQHRAKTNTWKISVDVGFRYLVRIHFSKSGLKMAENGHKKFDFLINHMIANIDADTRTESNDNGIILYRNYISVMKGHKQEGKRDLSISVQSNNESINRERPLKGFEIFKLSNPDNSLACPNPFPTSQDLRSGTLQNLVSVLGYSNAVATAAISMIVFANIIVHILRQFWENNFTKKENKPLVKGERFCLRFSLAEIKAATQNFNDEFVIGNGGFGTVYKGLLNDGGEIVALKRPRLNSKQGEHEFWREVETLSELRHLNLVSLIGYCNEHQEMILVYEYMPGGTLADHLYKKADDSNNSRSLSWNQRLSICIGAGRGLDYLHTGHGIIHRDVKSSNILLDENFVAKISDFGLAKPENRNMLHSYVSTNVKGTFGYFDPHYFRTRKLTRKSDTYAFGVLLLEVLCGRPALDPRVEEDKRSLTMWAQEKISEGELGKIISSDLRGDISIVSLKAFVKVAESCLNDEPKKRPTMAQVVLQLEFALKQHESSRRVTDEKDVYDVLPYADETISSASTENLTITSMNELNISSPPKEQNVFNTKLTSRERFIRRLITKQPKFWPWDVFWKRAKRSPKNQLQISISGQNKLLMERRYRLLKDYVTGVKATELDWATIEVSTNRFSHSNMIGKGLGGAYYKAVLPTGQVIAVKRNSLSEYGHNEFKLEIYLLSELQHPNLTKLLGYTIHGEEMILAYEFKAETSLHAVLFGRDKLPWTLCFKIIMGIAQGVLYLHQDSELRKLYSDLVPHNILLDIEMNPKISFDFENKPGKDLPLVLLNDKSYVHYDYAYSECNPSRQISVTSDIHSFGVMVLEIVSGMKHCHSSKEGLDLIAYAWKLWNEEKPLYLMEASTWVSGFSQEEVLRCIRVGLLCTQQQPKYRPMMPLVLRSLQGYHELQLELKETAKVAIESGGHRDPVFAIETNSAHIHW